MSRKKKWLFSLLHGIFLILFAFYWMNTIESYGNETTIVKWCSYAKQFMAGDGNGPAAKSILFVDVAFDKKVIPNPNGAGYEVITDRRKLAAFLKVIKQHQQTITYTLCDIFLKGESEDDSLLRGTLNGMHKIIFPVHFDQDGDLDYPDLEVPHAVADYASLSGDFFKFKLFQSDSAATVPVRMFQDIRHASVTDLCGLPFIDKYASLNSLIIDYQIRPYQLTDGHGYVVIGLSEILSLPEEMVASDFLKDRIIVIGDLQNDVHETIYGSTPGVLILINTYLSLLAGKHTITAGWLLFLLLSFTFLSKIMLFPGIQLGDDHPSIVKPILRSALWLTGISIFSYLFWDKHIQVLIIGVYLNMVHLCIDVVNHRWGWPQLKEFLKDLRNTYLDIE